MMRGKRPGHGSKEPERHCIMTPHLSSRRRQRQSEMYKVITAQPENPALSDQQNRHLAITEKAYSVHTSVLSAYSTSLASQNQQIRQASAPCCNTLSLSLSLWTWHNTPAMDMTRKAHFT
eukprot:1144200-Pelagomonas_calceolata.AAC.3